jgi:integrase
MGAIFKKAYTKPLPPGAEIINRKGTRLARWRDAKGKIRTAPITTGEDGTERIRFESSTYYARYRNGDRIVVEVSTGCRDEAAARSVLAELERRAERVRAGVISAEEDRVAQHRAEPMKAHITAYLEHMKAAGTVLMHRENTRRFLERLVDECGFRRLGDLNREAVERWLALRASDAVPIAARSRNSYRTAIVSFGNWAVSSFRLTSNPFKGLPKLNEAADPRRKRRAMTEAELVTLLDVARRRPLLDAMTVRRGSRSGQAVANVRDEVRERLEAVGRERALIYKTLVLTGLRKGELASLTVSQLDLDAPVPHVKLDAADEKSREGNGVVIRADLALDLRQWLDDKLAAHQANAQRQGEPIPARLPADTKLFDVPAGLVRIFDRDLNLAKIPKRDERKRTLDVHALRTTFGTLLSKGGVPLRTAQAAMRHSDPSLTANVYTDPKLLDVAGSLDALPMLPLNVGPVPEARRAKATETTSADVSQLALPLALKLGKPSESGTIGDKTNTTGLAGIGRVPFVVTSSDDSRNSVLTGPAGSSSSVGAAGFEPTTSRPPVPESKAQNSSI